MNTHELIKKDEWAIGALLALDNSAFSYKPTDRAILPDIANIFRDKNRLTQSQIEYVKKRMKKYIPELKELHFSPIKNKSPFIRTKNIIKTAILGDNFIRCRMSSSIRKDKDIIAGIRLMDDPSYHPSTKTWSIGLTHQNVEMLEELDFNICPDIYDWYDNTNECMADYDVEYIEGLKRTPFQYQIDGVKFIDKMRGRALIGDEMGLGKTGQALIWLHIHEEINKILIVCPASAKYNWENEINLWTNLSDDLPIHILSGKKPYTLYKDFEGIIIINYDILSNWKYQLSKIPFDVIIADEIHKVKNKTAKRTRAMMSLCKKIDNIIGLSGTPVTNKPIDFFYILNMIKPGLFPSRWDYATTYCGGKHNGFGWDFNGATNTKQLHKILTSNLMIRRKKSEVLKDLPEKIRMVVPLEINNQSKYRQAEEDIIAFLKNYHKDNEWIKKIENRKTKEDKKRSDKSKRAAFLVQAEKLKQLAIEGKMKQIFNWIDDYLESGQKLVVFTRHKNIISKLTKRYSKISVKLDGSVSDKKRQLVVDQFQQDDKIRLFFGNLKSCSEAITLTAANATCTIEFDWYPGIHDQAEDRVHRIGQTADCVYAYYLIAKGTIEEKIATLIDDKRMVLNRLLDGEDAEDTQLLMHLMSQMSEAK